MMTKTNKISENKEQKAVSLGLKKIYQPIIFEPTYNKN